VFCCVIVPSLHFLKLILSSTHSQPHILSSIEVAITIGIVPCPQSSGCPDPSAVGDVLYQGPYDPQPHGADGNYQNFTVTIPFNEDLIGQSQLTVNRFFLIGVSGFGLVVFSGSHADSLYLGPEWGGIAEFWRPD